MEKFQLVQRVWPAGFRDGQAVVHNRRFGHVIAVPPGIVPNGEVPVMYDDEVNCFVTIPADDLRLRYPEVAQTRAHRG